MKTLITNKRVLPLVSLVLIAIMVLAASCEKTPTAKSTTDTYTYNPIEQKWEQEQQTVKLPNPDGSQPAVSNTIIVRLDGDNPVKEIFIEQALVKGGNPPLVEIKGHDETPNASGKINIGTLAFITVDAEKLDIDADVVDVEVENVVAEDNELDLDLNAVNVVRTGRGASTSLFFGITRSQLLSELSLEGGSDVSILAGRAITDDETGVRVDRIRILGPQSGTAFVERLVIRRSSVFGTIEVDDVRIQNLILKNIMLDDTLP